MRLHTLVLQLMAAEREQHGIAPNRIVLGGFSQGGAVTMFTMLREREVGLAGAVVLASYVPLADSYQASVFSFATHAFAH